MSECIHHRNGGYGGCAKVRASITARQHEDGCWCVEVSHPMAHPVLKGTGHYKKRIWWIEDVHGEPEVCFRHDDFTFPRKVREFAEQLFAELQP